MFAKRSTIISVVRNPAYLLCLLLVLGLAGCGGSSGSGSSGNNLPPADTSYLLPPGADRTWLLADELLGQSLRADSPYHNAYFMPVGSASDALHGLSGTLTLTGTALSSNGPGSFEGPSLLNFPRVDLKFISHNGFLVPLEQGAQFNDQDSNYWEIIVSPGRTWSEPGDGNWSRASFPFVLIHRFRNQAHNGLASFLFDGQTVSNLRVQVVQETAAWSRDDYWGQLPVSFSAEEFPDETAIRAEFDQRRANELAIESWASLEALHGAALDGFDKFVGLTDISASGLLLDDIIYLSACPTRYGDFPYCRYMRHGAFSVTKSAGAALALLRLAQKYGPAVFDERIDSFLTITASHNGWTGVTFSDVLNMAVGVGDLSPDPNSDDIFADEGQPKMEQFQLIDSASDKLHEAFTYKNYPWGPGEKLRYNSTHTFVLAAALDAYIKSVEGPQASLSSLLADEVYRPIGITSLPLTETIEAAGQPGIPLLYVGMYPTIEDIARIAKLLQAEGNLNGEQILHQALTATALFRRSNQGLLADWWQNSIAPNRYLLSFWSWPIQEADGCRVSVPSMSGFGGNIVSILPNGVSAFRFADAQYYSPEPLIDIARRLGASC
jgi:hypothetical protein